MNLEGHSEDLLLICVALGATIGFSEEEGWDLKLGKHKIKIIFKLGKHKNKSNISQISRKYLEKLWRGK